MPPSGGVALRLDFDPARDGFSFPNRFTWTDADLHMLASALRPVSGAAVALAAAAGGSLGGRKGAGAGAAAGLMLALAGAGDRVVEIVATRWPSFGLCGGMALAAAERWPAEGRVPTSALQAQFVRPLLRRRQARTLRASLARFARHWSAVRWLPGHLPHAPLADDLARELDRIEARLRRGRPAILGLVGDAPDPFALHQVVAFGLDRPGPVTSRITVYDPNAPGQSRTIDTAPGPEPGQTTLSTSLPTGRSASTGRSHIATRPGHLSHLFVVDVEA